MQVVALSCDVLYCMHLLVTAASCQLPAPLSPAQAKLVIQFAPCVGCPRLNIYLFSPDESNGKTVLIICVRMSGMKDHIMEVQKKNGFK